MFRVMTWNFSDTAEPVVAGLLLATRSAIALL
jgi:hypothetical protein